MEEQAGKWRFSKGPWSHRLLNEGKLQETEQTESAKSADSVRRNAIITRTLRLEFQPAKQLSWKKPWG